MRPLPLPLQKNGTPQHYADMVVAAYNTAKKIDPQVKIGLTTANFAVSYLDMVLKAGAKDHFDYLCVHMPSSSKTAASRYSPHGRPWDRRRR